LDKLKIIKTKKTSTEWLRLWQRDGRKPVSQHFPP
jgi:hypothetical protein